MFDSAIWVKVKVAQFPIFPRAADVVEYSHDLQSAEDIAMAVHDWTLVHAGIFHDFHHEWISTTKRSLNDGLLPANYYALAEQIAGGLGPDILTLANGLPAPGAHRHSPLPPIPQEEGGVVVAAVAPPKVRFTLDEDAALTKRKRVVIRHVSGDRVVAMIEIVSPGNKSGQQALNSFVSKTWELLDAGVHLLILDLLPPGPRDPNGIPAAIWDTVGGEPFLLPADQPLTLSSYVAGYQRRAFIEVVAVGEPLPDMPLFLNSERYVNVPLEATYEAAWEAVPRRWQERLTAAPTSH